MLQCSYKMQFGETLNINTKTCLIFWIHPAGSLGGLVCIPRVLEELYICSRVVNVSKWMWTTCREDFCVLTSYRTKSPSMHLCPRWNRSVWDAERIKVDQTQRAGVVLMLRRLIVRVQPVPVLSGRSSLRRWLWFVCTVEDGLFCKGGFGLNITSKETRLPLFPPPVASLQRGKLLSLLCDARLTAFSALFEGFYSFPQACFVVGCLLASLSTSDRQTGVGTEMWSSRTEAEQQQHVQHNWFTSVSTVLFHLHMKCLCAS